MMECLDDARASRVAMCGEAPGQGGEQTCRGSAWNGHNQFRALPTYVAGVQTPVSNGPLSVGF